MLRDVCPYCGNQRAAQMPEAIKGWVVGQMNDPGGVALTLKDGRKLRVTGECDSCDFKKIADFIGATL